MFCLLDVTLFLIIYIKINIQIFIFLRLKVIIFSCFIINLILSRFYNKIVPIYKLSGSQLVPISMNNCNSARLEIGIKRTKFANRTLYYGSKRIHSLFKEKLFNSLRFLAIDGLIMHANLRI